MSREEIAILIIECPNLTRFAQSLAPSDFEELKQRTAVKMLTSKAKIDKVKDVNNYAAISLKNEFLKMQSEIKQNRELINKLPEEDFEPKNELKIKAVQLVYKLPTANKREKYKREILRILFEEYDYDILKMSDDMGIHYTSIYRAFNQLKPQIQFIYNQLKEL